MIKYFVILLILIGFSGTVFATDNQIIHTEHYQPDVKLLPDDIIQYGESFTIHAWLPTYDNKPEELQYFVDVWSSDNNQIDSTLWFAKEDFIYEFDTTHPAYNITKGGTYFIKIEKANQLQRTGSFYKTLEFKINFPQDSLTPLKQFNAGVRIDKIQCNESLQTILKTDGTPACVKLDSIEKLRERGWTNSKILSDELVREKLLELTGLLESGNVVEFNELRTELVAFILLERVDASGMNLDGINLKYTSLPGANLHNATLIGANIGNADLSNANLQDSDLKGADLSYTRLWGANLHGANLQDSNLEGASLRGADLTLANLQNANLKNADIPITANLSATDLRNVKDIPISIEEARERGAIAD